MSSKKVKRNDIGKGIGALLGNINQQYEKQPAETVKELASNVAMIPVEAIEANPFQPRVEFDEVALQELSDSIKVHGLIQPITVRRMNDREFQLISGERRLRASKMAGLKEVPAYIRLADDQGMLEMALIENIQRENLNAIEVAVTYQRLIDECGLTHESMAERVGKNRSSVTNYLRLLNLPPTIQSEVKKGNLSMGHARELAGVKDVGLQLQLMQRVLSDAMSVRQLEKLIKSFKEPAKSKKKNELPDDFKSVRDNLKNTLETQVDIKLKGKNRGQILISFDSIVELNRIIDLIEE